MLRLQWFVGRQKLAKLHFQFQGVIAYKELDGIILGSMAIVRQWVLVVV